MKLVASMCSEAKQQQLAVVKVGSGNTHGRWRIFRFSPPVVSQCTLDWKNEGNWIYWQQEDSVHCLQSVNSLLPIQVPKPCQWRRRKSSLYSFASCCALLAHLFFIPPSTKPADGAATGLRKWENVDWVGRQAGGRRPKQLADHCTFHEHFTWNLSFKERWLSDDRNAQHQKSNNLLCSQGIIQKVRTLAACLARLQWYGSHNRHPEITWS